MHDKIPNLLVVLDRSFFREKTYSYFSSEQNMFFFLKPDALCTSHTNAGVLCVAPGTSYRYFVFQLNILKKVYEWSEWSSG